MSALERLNALPEAEARDQLLACCGSTAWADGMTALRPFATTDELIADADRIWRNLGEADWREAFDAHPRIGERARDSAGERHRAWSEQEQSGALASDTDVMRDLSEGNLAYEDRFGHIFLICATGKSAPEILSELEARMTNDSDTELRVAAEEQRKIMHLRLQKLLAA